jgi:type 1 glutamine amidotransferase
MRVLILIALPFALFLLPVDAGTPKKRVLLLWHSPDGHPKDTHEYQLGQKILKATLEKHAPIEATLVNADDPWKDGPDLLAKADGVVLFVSEGAKWVSADAKRLEAFRAAAKRKAGLCVLHWGMGTKDAKNIEPFVALFGRCHGGPDRKYKVVDTDVMLPGKEPHPIQSGLSKFKTREEFYYSLKLPKQGVTPILTANIEGADETVAWAYARPDGGRSFGFTGLHYHENWQMPEYRRLIAQGVMWSVHLPIPKDGINVR